MTPSEFWQLSPHETGVWHKAKAQRDDDLSKREWQQTIWSTWHNAAFGRMKAMPKYERLLEMIGIDTNKKQTPADMLRIAQDVTVAMGGKINPKDKN
jgi:hypothetical protein